ncbi:hypothetical protein Tco_1272208 [Tanacetum coccineum]
MATNEETNAAGTDTRPPMLVESDYDSWKIRIHRYIRGKPNGKLIWKSIQNGPTPHPMITDPPPTDSAAMDCSISHSDDEIQTLVQKQIDEDMVHQKAILDLALQFDNACTTKEDLRKAYEKCNHILQESRALIDTFLKEGSDKDYELNLSMYRKAAKLEKQMNAKLAWIYEKYNHRSRKLPYTMDSNFTNENDPWEYSLDIDGSDLHLTPVMRSSSSAHVEPSPYTPNPVTINTRPAVFVSDSHNSICVEPSPQRPNPVMINPGPAGTVHEAKLFKKNEFILDPDGALNVDTRNI